MAYHVTLFYMTAMQVCDSKLTLQQQASETLDAKALPINPTQPHNYTTAMNVLCHKRNRAVTDYC